MEKFAIGLVVGGLGGALLVANNYKMRTLIKKGQSEVQAKLDKLMDEKIDEIDDAMEEVKEKAETVKEKSRKALKKAQSENG